MKKSVVMCLLFLSFVGRGQDTLKMMTYNLLAYTSGDNSRDQYFRTVIRHVHPDVLIVEEVGPAHNVTQQATVDSFFNRVINVVFPGQFSKGSFIHDSYDTANEIFYRSSKFVFISNTPVRTVYRDISEFKLYSPLVADTLRVYGLHLRPSNTDSFATIRGAEIDSLRKATNALPSGKFFIVCGDFNLYSAAESAYVKLLRDNPADDGHFVDPLSSIMTGSWHTQPQYAQYYTQSPRGGSFGGLDDRFDLILYSRAVSQPGKIRYLSGSLSPIGNDGAHYNDSINGPPQNTAVPDSVANALVYASDHLPVSARFVFTPSTVTNQYNVVAGWNIISVPLDATDYRKTSLYPSSTTNAFAFDQSLGYVSKDTLKNGLGYWLKFPSNQTVSITGTYRNHDTVAVSTGWNLIGSSSAAVAVTAIQQVPLAIVGSSYYEYSNGYSPADSLRPDHGYWIKVNQNGRLILR